MIDAPHFRSSGDIPESDRPILAAGKSQQSVTRHRDPVHAAVMSLELAHESHHFVNDRGIRGRIPCLCKGGDRLRLVAGKRRTSWLACRGFRFGYRVRRCEGRRDRGPTVLVTDSHRFSTAQVGSCDGRFDIAMYNGGPESRFEPASRLDNTVDRSSYFKATRRFRTRFRALKTIPMLPAPSFSSTT